MSGKVGPVRDHDEQGRQLVQVRFPGSNYRTYGYAVPKELGELEIGDLVWTEGNGYNPYGSPAVVKKIGSDYAGEFAQITCKLDPGYEPQTITVKRYMSAQARMAQQIDRGDPYGGG